MTITQPYEIRAFLGDDWTERQIEQITTEYLAAERDLGLDEDNGEQQALLTAIAQRVDGTLNSDEVVDNHLAALVQAEEAQMARRAAVIAEVRAGMSESEAARRYKVTRMTVRSWLGKG